METEDEDYETL